jgi:hypothetical protein
MKTIRSILALTATTILFGCSTTSPHRDFTGLPATDITASVTCNEPTMRFTGTIISDGRTERFSGTGSGTFHASGHELVCSFKKTGGDGQISISVSEAGKVLGGSDTGCKFGGVRAEVLRTPTERHDIFTTF